MGIYFLQITAQDASANSISQSINITVQDTTPPTWNPTPSNQSVGYGEAFSYQLNATDLQSITYSINDTTNFQINPSTGLIQNNTLLQLGTYSMQATATDASSNSISSQFSVTVESPPAPPPSSLYISINSGADYTDSASVNLTLFAMNASQCRFSNDGINYSAYENYSTFKAWELLPGDGNKSVYYQCRNSIGNESGAVYDSIILLSAPLYPPANLSVSATQANEASLTWVLSPSQSVIQYNIYSATAPGSQDFSSPVATVPSTANSWTSGSLADGNYYYVVRAQNPVTIESNSNEVSLKIDTAPPLRSDRYPLLGSVFNSTDVTISMKTNEPSNCKYGETSGTAYSSMASQLTPSSNALSHSVLLSSLSQGSHAYYIRCSDSRGNANTDDYEISFTINTTLPDSAPPVLSNRSPATGAKLSFNTTSTSMSINTDELSSCRYNESSMPYSSMGPGTTTSTGTSHSWLLSGLASGNTYPYYIRCMDTSGNNNSDDFIVNFSISQLYQNSSVDTIAYEDTDINSTGVADAMVTLVTNESVSGASINISTTSLDSGATGTMSVNGFKSVSIEMSPELSSAIHSILIKVYYTDEELIEAGITEESALSIHYRNESSGEWEKLDTSMDWVIATGVNTPENYVWAEVTHASTYSIASLTGEGGACIHDSDCISGYCRSDYDGGKFCAMDSVSCVHGDAFASQFSHGTATCYSGNVKTCASGIWQTTTCSYECSGGVCISAPASPSTSPSSSPRQARTPPLAISTSGDCAGSTYSLRVTSAGMPVSSASIEITSENSVSFYTTGSDGIVSFVPASPGTYSITARKSGYALASHQFTVSECAVQPPTEEPGEEDEATQPIPEPQPECTANTDCSAGMHCVNNKCVPKPECLSSSDCPTDETCISNKCVSVECECGYVQDHMCMHYECCFDGDCGPGKECIGHECTSIPIQEATEAENAISQLSSKVQELREKGKETGSMETMLEQMGIAYADKDYEQVLSIYSQAISEAERIEEKDGLGGILPIAIAVLVFGVAAYILYKKLSAGSKPKEPLAFPPETSEKITPPSEPSQAGKNSKIPKPSSGQPEEKSPKVPKDLDKPSMFS